jgi:hypothetical protein
VRAYRIKDRGTVTHRHDADDLLKDPGDFVLVSRGVDRAAVMKCPDGCGEVVVANLDARTGKAWKFYRKNRQISLYPSIWRDTGCKSHFILWNHTIWWCDAFERQAEVTPDDPESLKVRLEKVLTKDWTHYTDIALALDEVPWNVEWICEELSSLGKLVERSSHPKGYFRKKHLYD